MATWIPPSDRVDGNEHLGRRLFDEPMLVGARDQKSFSGLDVRHFEETRGDEVSLDRLGRSSVDRSVARYLQPLAEAAGAAFHSPRDFDGWAVLPAQKLQKPTRAGSLTVAPSPEPENPYHAHVDTRALLPNEPPSLRHYLIALHLRHLFVGPGSKMHLTQPARQRRPGSFFGRTREWISRIWHHIRPQQ